MLEVRKAVGGLLEIASVFAAAALVIVVGIRFAGEDLIARQAVLFTANIAMLSVVWLHLRRRGQGAAYLGLASRYSGWSSVLKGFAKSLAVLVIGLAGFMLGSVVMVNVTGMPQQADVSSYNYLQGSLPMLLLSLTGIYFVSSFGEEVIYRGFLIQRVEEMLGGGRSALTVAVLVSAVIFGLAHFGWGLAGVIQTTFMGLAFALAFLWFKRNLWILVAAHAYMDTALIVPLYFR